MSAPYFFPVPLRRKIDRRAQKEHHDPDSLRHRQEYLKLFEGYIDFLNLDVEAYLASMTHTTAATGGGDDDDDDDGGLGVATVNLAALKAVLAKHQVRAASQPGLLSPSSCFG